MLCKSFRVCLLSVLLVLAGNVGAQTLYLDPPRAHLSRRDYNPPADGPYDIFTLSLKVDFGIETAVGWGTTITLSNTNQLQFEPDFGGTGKPFLSTQPFFDTDLSDPFTAGSTLNLLWYNFADPDATLGLTGEVTLGQFQVRVLANPGENPGAPNVVLSALEIPPFGSAVLETDANNLLRFVNSAYITGRPPTPEPSAWLTMASGIGIGGLLLRRRRR